MDAKSVFTVASLAILANATVLAIAYPGLSRMLQPAAKYWQWGTLLIAIGCGLFAFGGYLPRPVMLTAANGFLTFGITAYCSALHTAQRTPIHHYLYLPATLLIPGIFWFSAITPNFKICALIIATTWLWLALRTLNALQRKAPQDLFSPSRKLLMGINGLFAVCTIVGLGGYLILDLPVNHLVAADRAGWGLPLAIILVSLPIVSTSAFLLLCSEKLRARLEHAAATDFLTKLPNRRTVAQHGELLFSRSLESGGSLAVAIIDIDKFKAVNDQYGHEIGDQALAFVASILQRETRASDIMARSGGEEFTSLFIGLDVLQAKLAAERIRSAIERESINATEYRIPITISIGIAARIAQDQRLGDVLRRADAALYKAKSQGRNRIEVATEVESSDEPCSYVPAVDSPSA